MLRHLSERSNDGICCGQHSRRPFDEEMKTTALRGLSDHNLLITRRGWCSRESIRNLYPDCADPTVSILPRPCTKSNHDPKNPALLEKGQTKQKRANKQRSKASRSKRTTLPTTANRFFPFPSHPLVCVYVCVCGYLNHGEQTKGPRIGVGGGRCCLNHRTGCWSDG